MYEHGGCALPIILSAVPTLSPDFHHCLVEPVLCSRDLGLAAVDLGKAHRPAHPLVLPQLGYLSKGLTAGWSSGKRESYPFLKRS